MVAVAALVGRPRRRVRPRRQGRGPRRSRPRGRSGGARRCRPARPRSRGRPGGPRRRSAPTMYSTSAGARRKLMGTRMRPHPHTPKNEVSSRDELWDTTATRSPGPDAQPVEARGLGPGPGGHLGEGQRLPGLGRLVGLVDQPDPLRVGHLGPVQEVPDIELQRSSVPPFGPSAPRYDRGGPIESNRHRERRGTRPGVRALVRPATWRSVDGTPSPPAWIVCGHARAPHRRRSPARLVRHRRRGGRRGTVVDIGDGSRRPGLAGPDGGATAWPTRWPRHPSLRWVQLPFAGVERVLAFGLLDHDHLWTCAKGSYAEPVAEHALALSLAGLRHLPHPDRRPGRGASPAGTSLYDQKVTILGGGGITSELLEQLAPFRVEATVVRRQSDPLPGAARTVPVECAPRGAPRTPWWSSWPWPSPRRRPASSVPPSSPLMDETAWLVNVARGAHVDTDALVAALASGSIAGAALDVTDPGAAARRPPAVGPSQLHHHAPHGRHHRDGHAPAGRADPHQRGPVRRRRAAGGAGGPRRRLLSRAPGSGSPATSARPAPDRAARVRPRPCVRGPGDRLVQPRSGGVTPMGR